MSTTVYLKFPDRDTWEGLASEETLALADVCGNLSTPEYTDEEGNTVPAHEVEGWHVNWPFCREIPEVLQPYIISTPVNPKCKFL